MKTLLISLLALAIIGLPQEAKTQGKGALTTKLPIDGNISFNPCTGEGVILAGNLIVVLHFVIDATGRWHVHNTVSHQGVTGVGMDTGARYIVSGQDQIFSASIPIEGPGAFQATFNDSLHMITPGSAENFIFHLLIHITVNANGDLITEVFSIVPECRG